MIFCGGFMSDMTGTKAQHLETFCTQCHSVGYVRFDYSGHGQSEGRFVDGTIGQWRSDTLAVIDQLTSGPVILVGSSMGGWIMLLAALSRPERVQGLVGIASAPDFTEELLWNRMSAEMQARLLQDGRIEQPSEYGAEPYIITRELVEEGRQHLLLGDSIGITCPIRLIHSTDDPAVPHEFSERIMRQVGSEDIAMSLLSDAGHRVSRDEDLIVIESGLQDLLEMT